MQLQWMNIFAEAATRDFVSTQLNQLVRCFIRWTWLLLCLGDFRPTVDLSVSRVLQVTVLLGQCTRQRGQWDRTPHAVETRLSTKPWVIVLLVSGLVPWLTSNVSGARFHPRPKMCENTSLFRNTISSVFTVSLFGSRSLGRLLKLKTNLVKSNPALLLACSTVGLDSK